MEVWKDIIGHEGLYQISNFGNVKSLYRKQLLKPYLNVDGYYKLHLSSAKYKSKLHSLHRLVAIHFVENFNRCNSVDHIDGDKSNNHYTNLQWLSMAENASKGWLTNHKNRKGSKNPQSKLNEVYAVDIKIMLKSNYTPRFISEVFGVTPATIYAIKRGYTWKDIAA